MMDATSYYDIKNLKRPQMNNSKFMKKEQSACGW
ncbi:hypothetical protein Metli_1320 [Methanofollis liminatans DSM 4140]|uniref:Uncharacterized protein n=1 Tax=Methanofollis liminatans DSM 4140 TaxID=28892 RepID=J1L3H7_9EURY|nr:hypothetical protein Metli_1320 [Methanofollis liminatans DSM 4140]